MTEAALAVPGAAIQITGTATMKLPGWWNDPGLSIRVRVVAGA